jgi:hypothetical protein
MLPFLHALFSMIGCPQMALPNVLGIEEELLASSASWETPLGKCSADCTGAENWGTLATGDQKHHKPVCHRFCVQQGSNGDLTASLDGQVWVHDNNSYLCLCICCSFGKQLTSKLGVGL